MGWDIESPTTLPSNLHLSNLELDNNEVLEYKFHTSWDWLMPVLVKIEKIEVGGGTWTSVYFDIEREHKKAVEFIKTYNDGNARTD
mgnify:FL=1